MGNAFRVHFTGLGVLVRHGAAHDDPALRMFDMIFLDGAPTAADSAAPNIPHHPALHVRSDLNATSLGPLTSASTSVEPLAGYAGFDLRGWEVRFPNCSTDRQPVRMVGPSPLTFEPPAAAQLTDWSPLEMLGNLTTLGGSPSFPTDYLQEPAPGYVAARIRLSGGHLGCEKEVKRPDQLYDYSRVFWKLHDAKNGSPVTTRPLAVTIALTLDIGAETSVSLDLVPLVGGASRSITIAVGNSADPSPQVVMRNHEPPANAATDPRYIYHFAAYYDLLPSPPWKPIPEIWKGCSAAGTLEDVPPPGPIRIGSIVGGDCPPLLADLRAV